MLKTKTFIIQILLHTGALSPLIILVWDYAQGQLTADPIREIQLRTGLYGLLLLTLSMACSPLFNFTGLKDILRLRRPLGLYAFLYASLHLLNFIVLDYGFNLALLWEDIAGKRYILAGFATFLILLALAITSTGSWTRRLGGNWQRLHRLVYAAGILDVLHYQWLAKVNISTPLIYGAVIILLLLLRLPVISRMAAKLRYWAQDRFTG
jgi:sulfoxide reductase heme-binding subunit YedZ